MEQSRRQIGTPESFEEVRRLLGDRQSRRRGLLTVCSVSWRPNKALQRTDSPVTPIAGEAQASRQTAGR